MAGLFAKPMLGQENSIITSLAVAAVVTGIYGSKVGPVADVHATNANDINNNAAIRKAGVEALALVVGVWLLSRDHNVLILGGATVIANELSYRHANMTAPENGQIQLTLASYLPAGGGTSSPPAVGQAAA